jgi:sugar lactone lactonase YvrE
MCILMFKGTSGSALNLLNIPNNIAYDVNTGNLYVSDTHDHRVMLYPPGASTGTVVAGGNGAGSSTTQLHYPTGIFFDSSTNSLIISNWNNNNVLRWVLGASSWTCIAGSAAATSGSTSFLLSHPEGVLLDSARNLYVVDNYNNRVQFFRLGQTNGTTIAGTGVAGNATNQLNSPFGLALDSQLNLYVSDTGNNRIVKIGSI